MKGTIILIFIFIGLFSSCVNNERTIYLLTDHAEDLNTDANVTLNGVEIGEVDDIQLNQQGKILIKLHLDKELELPLDSKFMIVDRNLLGLKGISVKFGNKNDLILNGDTIEVFNEENLIQQNTLSMKLQEIFENLRGAKQDSILYELRRLNNNLEELKK